MRLSIFVALSVVSSLPHPHVEFPSGSAWFLLLLIPAEISLLIEEVAHKPLLQAVCRESKAKTPQPFHSYLVYSLSDSNF